MAPKLAESRTGLGSGSFWLESVGNAGQSGNCYPCVVSPSQAPPGFGSLSSSQALGTWEPSTTPPSQSWFLLDSQLPSLRTWENCPGESKDWLWVIAEQIKGNPGHGSPLWGTGVRGVDLSSSPPGGGGGRTLAAC